MSQTFPVENLTIPAFNLGFSHSLKCSDILLYFEGAHGLKILLLIFHILCYFRLFCFKNVTLMRLSKISQPQDVSFFILISFCLDYLSANLHRKETNYHFVSHISYFFFLLLQYLWNSFFLTINARRQSWTYQKTSKTFFPF